MSGEKDIILSQCKQLLPLIPEALKSELNEAMRAFAAADEQSNNELAEFKLLTVLLNIASADDLEQSEALNSVLEQVIEDATDYVQQRMRQNLHRLNLALKRPSIHLRHEQEEERDSLLRLIARKNPTLSQIDVQICQRIHLKSRLKALECAPHIGYRKFCCFSYQVQVPPERIEAEKLQIKTELKHIRTALNNLHTDLIDPLHQSRLFVARMVETCTLTVGV